MVQMRVGGRLGYGGKRGDKEKWIDSRDIQKVTRTTVIVWMWGMSKWWLARMTPKLLASSAERILVPFTEIQSTVGELNWGNRSCAPFGICWTSWI